MVDMCPLQKTLACASCLQSYHILPFPLYNGEKYCVSTLHQILALLTKKHNIIYNLIYHGPTKFKACLFLILTQF